MRDMETYRVEPWSQLYPPNMALLRQIMMEEGYAVHQWCDQPEMEYGMHFHSEAQSHWVVSGSFELTVQNVGTFLLGPGDRDFMPANTYHSARVIGEEAVIYLIGVRR